MTEHVGVTGLGGGDRHWGPWYTGAPVPECLGQVSQPMIPHTLQIGGLICGAQCLGHAMLWRHVCTLQHSGKLVTLVWGCRLLLLRYGIFTAPCCCWNVSGSRMHLTVLCRCC